MGAPKPASPTFLVAVVVAAHVAAELLVVVVAEQKAAAVAPMWLDRGMVTVVHVPAFLATAAVVSPGWALQHAAAAHVLDSGLSGHGAGRAAIRPMTMTVHGGLCAASRPWTGCGRGSSRGCGHVAFALSSTSGMLLGGGSVSGCRGPLQPLDQRPRLGSK